MTPISCKVEGMHCNNCALSVSRYLEKKGMQNINVSFSTEEVSFIAPAGANSKEVLHGINQMGYRVVLPDDKPASGRIFNTFTFKCLFCSLFTLPLLLHMWINWPWLHHPWVQCGLTLPVYITGMWHFGRSALQSLRNRMANMDVLIALGASAAFFYSFVGTILYANPNYMFYETTAAIITLVFWGNLLEERSVKQTSTAIAELASMQLTTARLIQMEHGHEHIQEVDNRTLQPGNSVLVNTGDKIPMDGVIYWGNGHVNESMITGESAPVAKNIKDKVIGGTLLEEGSVKVCITAIGKDTVLSHIIELVKQAQADKPPMQKLADRISAIFVPLVLGIALTTFLGWYFIGHTTLATAMLRSIAVLVIACPCAMGLATPAAVMVGLGRAARHGILIKGGHTLELFKGIKQVVFDKTGTLTTGKLQLSEYRFFGIEEEDFKRVVYSLEKYSSHPIARFLTVHWKSAGELPLQQVQEHKGLGMQAKDQAGNEWQLGSFRMVSDITKDDRHQLYIVKNNQLAGWIDFSDEIRPEAAQVIAQLQQAGIRSILLSGDTMRKCQELASQLGISEIYAEQLPVQKLQQIDALMKIAPTAMVGDGINDAPALSKATIGIALSDASQVAMQSANVVLLNSNLGVLPLALGLGQHTYLTIKQNLFWAFIYNIVAIPVAALGFLNPIVGAGVMGLSDVLLAVNSIRLRYKNVQP